MSHGRLDRLVNRCSDLLIGYRHLLSIVFLVLTVGFGVSATQLKLDELIRAVENASDRFIDIEGADEADLERLQEVFRRTAESVRANGVGDPNTHETGEPKPV